MKKIILIISLALLSFIIVSCKKDSNNLDKALLEFADKNYQMDVEVLIYDEVQSNVTIKIDNNKSLYKEGEFVEIFYVRDNKKVTTYTKQGNGFEILETSKVKDEKYLLFQQIKNNWFEKIEANYELKEEFKEEFVELFDFDSDTKLLNAVIKLNNNSIDKLNISFESNRDIFHMNFKFSNFNQVTLVIPEVK